MNGLFCKSCSKQCTRCYLRSCENCTDFHTETGCVACDEVYSHLTEEIKQKHCDDFLFIYTQNYSNAFENIEYKKIQPISQYIDEFNIIEEYKKYLVRIGDVDGESETNSDDLADEVD
jgi:F0F1-type ATP synthase gamma subunit